MFLSMLNKLAFVTVIRILAVTVPLSAQAQTAKQAMTWRLIGNPSTVLTNGKTYVRIGSDSQTNPYSGDTNVSQALSLLCIRKSDELATNPIPDYAKPYLTPGGASRNTWSGGQVFAIPNVVGSSLLSEADADEKCNAVGKLIYGLSGFRMAEFHDGTDPNGTPGWDFWAQAYSTLSGFSTSATTGYWVKINDQNANPW